MTKQRYTLHDDERHIVYIFDCIIVLNEFVYRSKICCAILQINIDTE